MKTKNAEKIFELSYAEVVVQLWTTSLGYKAVCVLWSDVDGGIATTWVHNFMNMPARWVEMIYHDLDDHNIEDFIELSNIKEYIIYDESYA